MEEIRFLEINAEKRTIAVPSDLLLGVLGDGNVERVYFRCPKIVGDNINLAEHQIYVKYVTAPDNSGERYDKKEPGIYHCQDVIDEGEYITFSWKLSGNVFEKEGFIAFSVLAADGEVTRWNTFPAIGTVLITIPGGLEEVAEKYPDIITQLLNRMDEVEAIATPEAMQRYVGTYLAEHPVELDETLTDNTKAAPADVVGELKEETNHALQQSKATAIISTIKGEMLSTHSSAAIPPRNLKVFGKSWQDGEPSIDNPQEIQNIGSGGNISGKILNENVFNSSYRNNENRIWTSGCQIEVNNGVFTLTCTKTDMYVWNVLNNGQSYTGNSSLCGIMAIPSGVSKISVKLSNVVFKNNYITFYDENKVAIKTISYSNNVFTQKVIDGAKYFTIRFGKGDAVVGETYETTIMVNYGDQMDYIPYTEQPFTIQTPNGLPSIPVSSGGNYVDSNGQQYVADYVDFERGKIIRNTVIRMFSGNDYIGSSGGIVNGFFRCTVNFPELSYEPSVDGLCDKLKKGEGDMERFNLGHRMLYLWIDTSRLNGENSTLDDVKNFLNNNPIMVYAKRETPIETDLTEEELAQYQALCMNHPNTTIINDAGAYMEVEYVEDTKIYLTGNYVPISEHNALESRVSALEQMALN